MRPLEGLRVIDFTQIFAGPGTGMYLADQGADVIKVEPPSGGRDRAVGGGGGVETFMLLNRGKRSLVLDIRGEQGHDVVHRLVRRSDVMLVAWPPGQAERLGYGYEAMRELNQRLIYASITGWGAKGPLSMKTGYDRLMQAHTGLMDRNRAPDGTPMAMPTFLADQGIPMALSYGIMLALWVREKTGQGRKVEVSQLQTMIALQSVNLVFREDDQDMAGSARHPSYTYRAQDDRWLTLVPILESEWSRLWECLALPDLQAMPEVLLPAGRLQHNEHIQRCLTERFESRPLADWLERLEAARVPAMPVLSVQEFRQQSQAWANDMLVAREDPEHGRVEMMGLPVCVSETEAEAGWPPPAFGEHTYEVLADLGYSAQEIEVLVRDRVVAAK